MKMWSPKLIFLSIALLITMTSIIMYSYKTYNNDVKKLCDLNKSFKVEEVDHWHFENESLVVNGKLFKEGEFYKDEEGAYRICPLYRCLNKTCIKKCCPANKILFNNICVESEIFLTFNNVKEKLSNHENNSENVEIFTGAPVCDFGYWLEGNFTIVNNHLVEDVQMNDDQYQSQHIDLFHYCIDFEETDEHDSLRYYSYVCFPDAVNEPEWKFERIFLAVIIVYLFITFFTYALIPNNSRPGCGLHVLFLINHSVCLMFAFTATAAILLGYNYGPITCKIIGYSFYNGAMSAFLWMNVICFDMWLNVGSMISGKPICGFNMSNAKKIISYSAYAYGIPLLISVILHAMDSNLISVHEDFLPKIANHKHVCIMNTAFSYWAYLYVPLSIFLSINTALFVYTLVKTNTSVNQFTEFVNKDETNGAFTNQQFLMIMYVKIFTVIKVTWILELVVFYLFFHTNISPYLWFLLVILKCLRGLIIFYIFVLKPKIPVLKQKFRPAVSENINCTNENE